MGTHYEVLGIRQSSSHDEIKQAYHRLAMEYHPDKNPSPGAAEKMKQINEAYRTLSDAKLRARYDAGLFSSPGENLYSRWYRQRPDGDGDRSRPGWADFGRAPRSDYAPPRGSVVYESVTMFSFEHLVSSAVIGVAFGLAIASAFAFFGIDTGSRYGLAALAFFALVAVSVPAFTSILLLKNSLLSKAEAGTCGSITLAMTLPAAVIVASFMGVQDGGALTCCLGPLVSMLAGWVVGGFVGKLSYDVFRG